MTSPRDNSDDINTTSTSANDPDDVHQADRPSYSTFACIGTGFSGICLGATLARWYGLTAGGQGGHHHLRLFSRDPGPGGTWLVNDYPGAACDVPSALYSFSFAPNPAWTRVLPPAAELRAYLAAVADRYRVTDGMVFNADVFRCVWIEDRAVWRLWVRREERGRGGKWKVRVLVHECRYLFSATGLFTQPRELDVPGLERFRGPVFHSARWRSDVDLTGKRVVLFGNGCTAAQIVPAIAGRVRHLTQVVRSKHWVYPPIDRRIPGAVRALLAAVPGLTRLQRFLVYVLAEASWRGFKLTEDGARYRRKMRERAEEYMRRTAPAEYHDMLIPDFEVGCKRRIFDSGYLETLHAENVTLTDEPVAEILPDGLRMRSGTVVEADVIIMANGFATNQYLPGVEVVGRDGETLAQHWESFGGPEAYNCTSLSGFPNMFFLLGPNTATGHTSAVMAIENAVNYALRVLRPALDGRAGVVVSLKRPAEEAFARRIQSALRRTVWSSGCSSWYVRGPGGKAWNAMTYPWSQARYWYESLFPVWRDWEYTVRFFFNISHLIIVLLFLSHFRSFFVRSPN
ncbi:hypothetical protein MYCTH_54721 [Thermothelomyces thermophilus ATCC 42464]|uniref:L-ornithine N(5)-oxygenase n=1 Tax=Thermothelomyces thermophilus (strain ATCC 42464 / BCRC 31852 / DSM 1799) TaxID=573729 RepID=G2QJL4_THET4|nr:uncharacterized protein MYCTH_54721 [Thermothelomyces thermophilus ATCC 42464]AEO59771.1 hypothetical protein MYCTH_54721 [Thermothelomyces thermophilus ATCC 42464]